MKLTKQQAAKQLADKLASESTENLIMLAETLNTSTDAASIIATNAIDRELEKRMSKSDFEALQARLEAELLAS